MDFLFFLQNTWFILIGVLLTGYAILDGFDLGVGILFPFLAKTEEEKREKVKKVVVKMRQRFSKMTSEERSTARERMNTPEGKERMAEALDFYYNEFTPEERQMLDPIVEEFTIQMGRK